jgi:hypothetical protein
MGTVKAEDHLMRPDWVALATWKATEEHGFIRVRRRRPSRLGALHDFLARRRDLLGSNAEGRDVKPGILAPGDQPLLGD